MYPYRAAHTLSTILRKAEGSRGGHIIGHTHTGKPIYANKKASHKDYSSFSRAEHDDAMNLHAGKRKSATAMSRQFAQQELDGGGNQAQNKRGAEYFDRVAKVHEKMGDSHAAAASG